MLAWIYRLVKREYLNNFLSESGCIYCDRLYSLSEIKRKEGEETKIFKLVVHIGEMMASGLLMSKCISPLRCARLSTIAGARVNKQDMKWYINWHKNSSPIEDKAITIVMLLSCLFFHSKLNKFIASYLMPTQ